MKRQCGRGQDDDDGAQREKWADEVFSSLVGWLLGNQHLVGGEKSK